jgi:hypothetical protein
VHSLSRIASGACSIDGGKTVSTLGQQVAIVLTGKPVSWETLGQKTKTSPREAVPYTIKKMTSLRLSVL